jgi:DNA-binding HxlR family transcriptional regulator
MLKREYEGQVCSIARSLELVGDRWTLLIVRDLVLGLSRFDQLLASLGIASNVLTDRLNRLDDEGIVKRVRYSDRPERFEYQLTKKGRELGLVLLALLQWGDRHVSDKPPRIARRRSDQSPVRVALVYRRRLAGRTRRPRTRPWAGRPTSPGGQTAPPLREMKVVVSGGTQFIGPYVVRLLAEQGHEVTIVHRGETEAELPDAVQGSSSTWVATGCPSACLSCFRGCPICHRLRPLGSTNAERASLSGMIG